jgi:sulfhydrogenase subunit gamma (sulfur reductase)
MSNDAATPTTRVVRVALDGSAFAYRAGQAALLGLHENEERTPYSIASSPFETASHGHLEFLIKVDGSSRFGAIVSDLQPGLRIFVSPAGGRFGLPPDAVKRPLLFIGGGTGVAPLRSMILDVIHEERADRPPALVYSARSPEEFAYADELRALHDAGKLKLILTLTGDARDWRHARGRAGAEHLADLATTRTLCFICGPPSMVTDLPQALMALGIPRPQIRTEDW